MTGRILALILALASLGIEGTAHAQSVGEPLTPTDIEMIEMRARGDFVSGALQEGLEGDAVGLVFEIERATSPILELSSTTCPVRVEVNNITDRPLVGIHFSITQGFERNGAPVADAMGSTSTIEIPLVPARSRVHARVECPEPPSYLLWGSDYGSPVTRSVTFSTFGEAYGLEPEGLSSMAIGTAQFGREYGTYIPGFSTHSLLWFVIDASSPGPALDDLIERALAQPDARSVVFQYLADAPSTVQSARISQAIADLPARELNAVYAGLPVDVAGQALSLLDERAFSRTERALRTTPEGRAALLSMLAVTANPEQFRALGASVDDTNLETALIALAAGMSLEADRVALFDQLMVRARTLPPERQAALALALYTRWVDHQVPSLELDSRVLATRDMGAALVDSMLRMRAAALDTAFTPGLLPTDIDALELYRLVSNDLASCGSSISRLEQCADTIEASPSLFAIAQQGGLRAELLTQAQAVLVENVSESTLPLVRRYEAFGMAVGPIAERACYGGGGYYGGYYGGSYGNVSDDALELARSIDPNAECVRSIVERQEAEQQARIGRVVVGVILFFLAVLSAVLFGRRGIRKLEGIRHEADKTEQTQEGGRVAARIAPEPFANALSRGLRGTETAIRAEGANESEAVARALAALRPHEAALTKAARSAVEEVVSRGKLSTSLLELGDVSVYLVAVPGMHDQPQAFRRYEPFAEGWLAHVDRLKAMVARSGMPTKILCLLFFVRPDGTETALVVGYEDGATRYLPFGLLDEEEVQSGVGRQGTHREQWSPERGSV